jgi:hypothetical protein
MLTENKRTRRRVFVMEAGKIKHLTSYRTDFK